MLGITILLLAVAHLATQTLKFRFGLAGIYGLVDLFDMAKEANLPTWFSGLQLLVCALLLAVIGRARRHAGDRFAAHWLGLAAIFLLLATDEMASLHELSIRPIQEMVPGLVTGWLYWAWVIPGGLFVLGVAAAYARFVFSYLPDLVRNRTIAGGLLFVIGAVGVEMPEAAHVQVFGMENLTYGLFVLVEETLEMAGILVFMSGLFHYLRTVVGPVVFVVARDTAKVPMASSMSQASGVPRAV